MYATEPTKQLGLVHIAGFLEARTLFDGHEGEGRGVDMDALCGQIIQSTDPKPYKDDGLP